MPMLAWIFSARPSMSNGRDRKSTRLNSSHPSTSYVHTLSLHDALPIFPVFAGLGMHAGGVKAICAGGIVFRLGLIHSGICMPDQSLKIIGIRRIKADADARMDIQRTAFYEQWPRSEEHTSELQSPVHLLCPHSFPTRRSSDLPGLRWPWHACWRSKSDMCWRYRFPPWIDT